MRSLLTTISQTSLAVAILVSTIGTYMALTPPNNNNHNQQNPILLSPSPSANDTIRQLNLTNAFIIKILLIPFGILTLHTSILTFFYPNIPRFLLGHGIITTITITKSTTTTRRPPTPTPKNPLNPTHLTWTPRTLLPLLLNTLFGIPLRLHSYTTLGKDFTFNLTTPSSLQTGGIYAYIQHPSYTGLVIVIVSNLVLLLGFGGRKGGNGDVDGDGDGDGDGVGVWACWVPPSWLSRLRNWEALAGLGALGVGGLVLVLGGAVMMGGVWMRVREEEDMLKGEFGAEWEEWHVRTARFIPWVF